VAEYRLRERGGGRFESHSAGAKPTRRVNPHALRVLKDAFQIDVSDARSESWVKFCAVRFEFVITVRDDGAEVYPAWPGQPIVAHWPASDPARFQGPQTETYKHFWKVAQLLYRRIDLLCCLPIKSLDRLRLEQAARDIARQENAW
jgi:arsenate reductase (thioredoxin)